MYKTLQNDLFCALVTCHNFVGEINNPKSWVDPLSARFGLFLAIAWCLVQVYLFQLLREYGGFQLTVLKMDLKTLPVQLQAFL